MSGALPRRLPIMSILTATDFRIEPREQRVWAALAHLSGLCTYLVPLGGIIAPILLILAKDSDPIVRSIAKQALYLNVAALLMVIPITVMAITIIGIPFAIVLGIVMGLAAFCLPIIGAIQSMDGRYYSYPIVGHEPEFA